MGRLINDIGAFLKDQGFDYTFQIRHDFDVICVMTHDGAGTRVILPIETASGSIMEARLASLKADECIRSIALSEGYPIIIAEDRWHSQREMMQARLLSHLELFAHAFARNCEVRRIDKDTARRFLDENHSYGYAACKYCYGLFLKKHPEDLIAAATFSNARKWIKDGKEIRSYEWTRYASLPGLRVSGGMGKLLKAFIKEVQPDDIMSYADLEWSEGAVYKQLGFTLEDHKTPVLFEIDSQWRRSPVKPGMTCSEVIAGSQAQGVIAGLSGNLFYMNFGSNKYRLKLTQYE